ncbi:MAG: pyridoxal phosphate-dependent decarboxylase family protein [Steroidobacteraceae bacterium]
MSEPEGRNALMEIAELAEEYLLTRATAVISPRISEDALKRRVEELLAAGPRPLVEVAADLFAMLGKGIVRTDSPRYFGLFNPPAMPEAAAGDLIAAVANPQLAVWSHAPAAVEIEARMIRLFGGLIGWPDKACAGTFTSGGAEANHTAVLAALARRYPDWARRGVAGLPKPPALFVSAEAHLAWIKIARAAGLGSDAVRLITPADGLRLTGDEVARAIANAPDVDPAMIAATAGATAHGAIDDLSGLAAVARACGAHFHVDAAWAGAALLAPEWRRLFAGIELADSVTLDPHKWLCVPMGAGMYLARDWVPLETAFDVSTGYMPSASRERRDPYLHSLQWSRRFIGLKLFTAFATLGRDELAERMTRQFDMGKRLRLGLGRDGWCILNDTELPIACFAPAAATEEAVRRIEAHVTGSGRAWVSTVRVRGQQALRACITSYETGPEDVDELLALLDRARAT